MIKKNGLRADSGYHIRNYLDENELENARQIIEHPNYKPKPYINQDNSINN